MGTEGEPAPLEQELSAFESKKVKLLQDHPGKFALIRGEEFVGAYDTPENAYEAGIKRFGNTSFLVKKISETEEEFRNQALPLGLTNARL